MGIHSKNIKKLKLFLNKDNKKTKQDDKNDGNNIESNNK